jgi:dipeptidyl aminopeptidase/acylaminoacyl peptidase
VQGAATWYGVFDMATIAAQARQDKAMSRDVPEAPEWQLLGCFGNKKRKPKQIAAASPVTYVDRNDPPMLLIVGSPDTTVPYQQTLEMADRIEAACVKHRLIVLPGVNHSFIGENLEQTRDANLKALSATLQFFDQTIGNASSTNG